MRTVFKTSYDADINLFRHGQQAAWYIALLVLAVGLPFLLGTFWLGEMTNVLIWAIAGMGLMVLVGQTGQASLGHAAFLAIGCYANVLLQDPLGLPFILSFPLAGLIEPFSARYIAAGYSQVMAYLLLFVILVFRPHGILAQIHSKKV